MTIQTRTLDPATGIDWDQQSVWVQNMDCLTEVGKNAEGIRVFLGSTGRRFAINDVELEANWTSDGRVYRQYYTPVQAHTVASEVRLVMGGKAFDLVRGDAIIRHADGDFSLVQAAEFAAVFEAVAWPGTRQRPLYPFAT